MRGTVVYFNNPKGFGFLAAEDQSQKFFFHIRNVVAGPVGSLLGLEGTFDVIPALENGKFPQAINVALESPKSTTGGAR